MFRLFLSIETPTGTSLVEELHGRSISATGETKSISKRRLKISRECGDTSPDTSQFFHSHSRQENTKPRLQWKRFKTPQEWPTLATSSTDIKRLTQQKSKHLSISLRSITELQEFSTTTSNRTFTRITQISIRRHTSS